MNTLVKEAIQYFGDVDADGFARAVADDAARAAQAALRRRRPDLNARSTKKLELPDDERAQFELDQLAFVASVADRLMADVNGLVFNARRGGASWARIGGAINESAQTAFNRYRRLDGAKLGAGSRQASRRTR